MRANRLLAALAVPVTLGFTWMASDSRVEKRVDPRVRAQVAVIVDSLEKEGLYPEPLVQYALEGSEKCALPGAIRNCPAVMLAGVQKWATDIRRSRGILGPAATPDEVNAGAKALRAGASVDELARFREAKIERRLSGALNTIAHLINKGVPADTASRILVNLALGGASDAQLGQMQEDIERNIAGGMPAGAAAIAGAIGVIDAIEARARDGAGSGAPLPSTRVRPPDPMANGSLRGSALGNKGEVIRPPAPRGRDNKLP